MGQSGMMADGGDVTYPLYLINGRPDNDPDVFPAKPGDRVRLRIINAGADTIFTVALADHELSVTHTDGYPVRPVATSALRIGMGERYDAVVDLADGVCLEAPEHSVRAHSVRVEDGTVQVALG